MHEVRRISVVRVDRRVAKTSGIDQQSDITWSITSQATNIVKHSSGSSVESLPTELIRKIIGYATDLDKEMKPSCAQHLLPPSDLKSYKAKNALYDVFATISQHYHGVLCRINKTSGYSRMRHHGVFLKSV